MKSLVVAITCIVAISCGPRKKPADPFSGLEASEKVAILHLNQEDRERYLHDKPLKNVRDYLMGSGLKADVIGYKLMAVQRSQMFSSNGSGWRMVMLSSQSVVVFHVTDDHKCRIQVNERLDDVSKEAVIFSFEQDSGPDKQTEQLMDVNRP
jgi:hypothetical protein